MKEETVMIQGMPWTIRYANACEDSKLTGCDGYCDSSIRTCVVFDGSGTETDPFSLADVEHRQKQVKRHELVHAYLAECGLELESWAANEEIVDWIASQFPKLSDLFRKADAI